jgi:formamidopyrimidine-DNA glycosylase
MPELPEVETIARTLHYGSSDSPALVKRKITGAEILWSRTVAEPAGKEFKRRIVGQVVQKVNRRGKFIQIHLSDDVLLVHLRMSGDLIAGEGKEPLGSHPRLVIYLDKGLQLSFSDARKFGRVWLVSDPKTVTGKLGPEPLDADFTPEEFTRRLLARKRQIKPLLLDQSFLAGVGNIYADESLHLAKIHPLTRSDQLSAHQAAKLLKSIRQVLENGIESNGASIDWVYRGGGYQNQFRVYGRAGEPCPVCATPIERIVVGQRGTYYCPNCQVQVKG